MGDFRRRIHGELEGFLDAVAALHAKDMEALENEILSLRQDLDQCKAQQGQARAVHTPTVQGSPSMTSLCTLKVAHESSAIPVAPNSDASLPHTRDTLASNLPTAGRVHNRYTVKDFWKSKYHLLQHGSSFSFHTSINRSVTRPHLYRSFASTLDTRHFSRDQWPCVLDPDGHILVLWGWFSMVLFMYDVLYIPLELAFDAPETKLQNALAWLVRIFWTLDIVVSSFAGVYTPDGKELRLKQILFLYWRSWFVLDLIIVSIDWISYVVVAGDWLRSLTLLRIFRLLRLSRLLRYAKLRGWFSHLVNRLSVEIPSYMMGTVSGVTIVLRLIVIVHLLACLWHLLGKFSGAGWVNASPVPDSAFLRYFKTVQWALTLHDANEFHHRNTADYALACAAALAIIVVCSVVVATSTHVVFAINDNEASKLVAIGWRLSKSHRLSRNVVWRLQNHLRAHQFPGTGEEILSERMLVASLPESLQVDITAEIRAPTLTQMQFFCDMENYNPRALRKVCHSSVSETFLLGGDKVFAPGDGCTNMYFAGKGAFHYIPGKLENWHLRDGSISTSTHWQTWLPSVIVIQKGQHVSEPVLWTTWEHKGDLVAIDDSCVVTVSADKFEEALRHNQTVSIHALMYARHFVWHLNHCERPVMSDLVDISLPFDILHHELFIGSEDDHFFFISHFKQESGTEAAMMGMELERMIRDDLNNAASEFKHPVFIDSENLRDLATLTSHVKKSKYLLLLLTPGILSRPWCLVEIAHAVRHDVELFPVQIRRPGTSFEFPGEAFYDDVVTGKAFIQETLDLLRTESIPLAELAHCLRAVFRKIALPFSPHSSQNIRLAELAEILTACTPISWDELKTPKAG